MTLPDEVKIEVEHRLAEKASEEFGQDMWRGIYVIRMRDDLVARGRTLATFKNPLTSQIAARREAEKLAEEMLRD